MTNGDLQAALHNVGSRPIKQVMIKDRPAKARFDFPLHGRAEHFDIERIDPDGTLVLYNPTVNRPLGHDRPDKKE